MRRQLRRIGGVTGNIQLGLRAAEGGLSLMAGVSIDLYGSQSWATSGKDNGSGEGRTGTMICKAGSGKM